jgi:DNA ligase-1
VKFQKLAKYFQKLESTGSRNEMTVILARLLREAKTEEVDKIGYLSLGRLGPKFATVEFNLAEKMMVKVLATAYQKTEEAVRKQYKKIGDLGEVAEFLDTRRRSEPMEVREVYERLYEIASEAGEGSVERKIEKMAKLLDDLSAQSAKYVVRIPLGKLRLGFSDMTILDALSWMISGDKSKRGKIEAAYNIRADVGQIARLAKRKGLKGLKNLKVSLGTPIVPALCQRLPTAEEMIEKMAPRPARGKVAVEPKYDGTRLQIHYQEKKTAIFTRNLENVVHMFPDIVEALPKEVKAKEFVLDGEAIGVDPKTGKFLPFQETIKRKRKYQIKQMVKEIPLKLFCFDILYKDGRDLLRTPFKERRKILEKVLSSRNKTILISPQIVTEDPEVIRQYHDEQIKKGLEGAVLKKWEAAYDPGKRGYTWVKFKSEKGKKGGGLTDTLDCVVMGYYRGRGKRAQFGIGAFLVGIKKDENFLTVSKIGTGLSDEQWREMYQRCEKVKTGEKPQPYQVDKNLEPDVWCSPSILVEVEADNITQSPIHTVSYALRFPRLVRFRDDKSADQATTIEEVEKLYNLQ